MFCSPGQQPHSLFTWHLPYRVCSSDEREQGATHGQQDQAAVQVQHRRRRSADAQAQLGNTHTSSSFRQNPGFWLYSQKSKCGADVCVLDKNPVATMSDEVLRCYTSSMHVFTSHRMKACRRAGCTSGSTLSTCWQPV